MIQRLILAILMLAAVAAAGAAAWAMLVDDGYVLIAWSHYRYQSTVWVFALVCAVIWALLFGLRRSIYLLLVSTQVLNPWSSRNRMRRVEHATQRGFLELSAGHWPQALRLLSRAAALSEQPLTAYLGAARAASELGQLDKSEGFLERALENEPKAAIAVTMTRAQLQIDRGDDVAARRTLEGILEKSPRHRAAMRLLQALLERQQDWAALNELMPGLRRRKMVSDEQADNLETMARCAVLRAAAAGEDSLPALQRTWISLPKKVRQQTEMIACQAALLMGCKAPAAAEELLREAIKRNFDEKLVALYVQTGDNPQLMLSVVEDWLKKQGDNAALLLAAGRLALRCEQWERARDLLENSLKAERRAETCTELARLLANHFGDAARSNQLYQEGLELIAARNQPPILAASELAEGSADKA